MVSCFVSLDSTEEGAEATSKPMSAWNPFFVLRAVDFFGVDGDSSLPVVFADTYPEEVLAGDSVLQSPERFGRVLSPIEQRRLCDRQVFRLILQFRDSQIPQIVKGRVVKSR